MITPAHVHIVPPDVQSDAALRKYLGFDEHTALYPQRELFVLWFRQDPRETFAVLMSIPRSREGLSYWDRQWPLIVDPETRVVRFDGAPSAQPQRP